MSAPETDLRQGMTSAEREVLVRVGEIVQHYGRVFDSEVLLSLAANCAFSAHAAKPGTWKGHACLRRKTAIEAAAQLLAALRLIEAGR